MFLGNICFRNFRAGLRDVSLLKLIDGKGDGNDDDDDDDGGGGYDDDDDDDDDD